MGRSAFRLPAALGLALLAFVLAPAAAAEAPPDAFCIVVIEPTDGFRQVRITVDEDLDAAAKDASWRQVDLNGDGRASRQEGEAFRYATLKLWPGGLEMGNRSLHLEFDAPYMSATPIRPVYATTWRHLGHGYYGEPLKAHDGTPIDGPVPFADFETQAVREYGFHVQGDISRVTLHGAKPDWTGTLQPDSNVSREPKPVIEYVVVRAPPGWIVKEVQGYGYEGPFVRAGGEATLELQGFDTSAPWAIVFHDPEAEERLGRIEGSPGLGAAAAVAALAGLAAAARLRRGGRGGQAE